MKKGVLSIAGSMVIALFISACNDTSKSSTSNAEVATKDTATATPAAPAKKKGKASMGTVAADNAAKVEKDKEGVYTKAEVMPEYPGNASALSDYINSNLTYPQDAIDNNVEGTVNVQFVVDEKGNISDVKTIGNKLGYGLEEEAVTVVNKLPKWAPGKVKGKSVKTRLTIPITYKLEG